MSDPQGDAGQQAVTEPKQLTQEQVDAIVRDRLAREREKYADYDALKQRAEKWAEYEEAQKSETQKALDAAQKATAERDEAIKTANQRLIQAEFIAIASRLGVAHPEDAFALANRSDVILTDDGNVEGVENAVKALIDANRLPLIGRPAAATLDGGAGSGERASDKPALTESELVMAKKLGLTPEQYQKHKNKE